MEKIPAPETGRRSDSFLPVFKKEAIEQSIAACFARIVALYPDRLAIKGASCTYTYDALNREANRVAHAILEQRAGARGQIGILAAQEAGIAAVLGTLKAGKTYVPLDPSYPPARLSRILQECEIDTIVTENKYFTLSRSLSDGSCRVISIHELDAGLSFPDADVVVSPDALAAIIYTSGSTGDPKGVMQSQRNVLHRVMLATNAFAICPEDRVTFLSSLTFGASLLELFATLLNGAAVYPFNVAEEGLSRLADWLIREKLTIYHSVPTIWRQLTRSLSGKEDLRSLRLIRLGGDTLTTSDVELYRSRYPSSCILFNSLSCSEAGLIRLYRVDGDTHTDQRVIPLGYELDDKEVLVLDEHDQEAGHNEVGELVIRSEFLSPGYWKNPELTLAVFRPDPTMHGQRRYYSGDLGSLLPDGCLLYKGRKDSRTKIHGIGVETTQLEAALRSHPHVREAIAVANEDQSGERRLVAYVVPEGEAALTTTELRRFLVNLLPAQMLSASFVFLNALPLTPSGKVDRPALPGPTGNRPQIGQGFIAPRDLWEHQLTRICQSILGIDRIGVEDNLFDLGIDSLKAVRLVTQIEKTFADDIPPATLLQSPTVALLAAVLRQKSSSKSWSSLLPVQCAGSKPPFFWVHGDFSNAFLPEYLGPDQPLYALDHQGQDGKPALHTTVETIATNYLQEIRSVQAGGPYFIGGYSFGGIVAFEIAQQLWRVGDRVALLALLDPPGFTVSRSPYQRKGGGLWTGVRITSLRARVRLHLKQLAGLRPIERWDYLLSKGVGKIGQGAFSRTRRIRKTTKRILSKIHLRMEWRIPSWLRSTYLLDVYNRARLNYAPQVYRGRAVLFRGTDLFSRFQTDWEGLLQGHLELFELGEVDHMKLRDEAYVHVWAKQLRISLSEAQADPAAGKQSAGSSSLAAQRRSTLEKQVHHE